MHSMAAGIVVGDTVWPSGCRQTHSMAQRLPPDAQFNQGLSSGAQSDCLPVFGGEARAAQRRRRRGVTARRYDGAARENGISFAGMKQGLQRHV